MQASLCSIVAFLFFGGGNWIWISSTKMIMLLLSHLMRISQRIVIFRDWFWHLCVLVVVISFRICSEKVADITVFQSSQLVIFKCKHSMEVRVQGPPRGCITNQCSRWNHIVCLALRYWTTMSPRIIAVKGQQIHLITMNSFLPSTHLLLIMLTMIPLLVQASRLIEVLYLPNILSHTGQININHLKIQMGHQ